jgi:pimeloyl-ACP methyl ester carboxylesterase
MGLINKSAGLVVRSLSGERCSPHSSPTGVIVAANCCPSATNMLPVAPSATCRRPTSRPLACTMAWFKHNLQDLVISSLAASFLLAPTSSWSQSLKYHCVNDSKSAVVFLHGFLGDPYASFRADNGVSWQELICADRNQIINSVELSDFDVISIEWASSLDGSSSLVEISQQIYELIQNDKKLSEKYEHIYFIAHSAGGIILERILITMALTEPEDINRIKAVFLLATPSNGSPIVESITGIPKAMAYVLGKPDLYVFFFPHAEQLEDLRPGNLNSFLQTVRFDVRNMMERRSWPRFFCAYEKKRTNGVLVVPEIYTQGGPCRGAPRPITEDHIHIVKPSGPDHETYSWFRGKIQDVLEEIIKTNSLAGHR